MKKIKWMLCTLVLMIYVIIGVPFMVIAYLLGGNKPFDNILQAIDNIVTPAKNK